MPRLRSKPRSGDRFNDQLEKCFTNNNFVAVFDIGWRPGLQALTPVHIGAIEAADIFDGNLTIFDAAEGMLARDLCFRIVGVEVDLGERASLRIPSPDEVVAVLERELLTLATS